MQAKPILKRLTDLAMTVLLLLLMAYSLVGEAAHEWLGTAIFALFVLHHFLNWKWCRNLFRGSYPPIRVLQTVLAALVFLCMAGSTVSGVLLSRYVFRLDNRSFGAVFRAVHLLSAYWGFAFLSLHLGLHWGGILNFAGRNRNKPSNIQKWALRAAAVLIAAYGAYAFVKRDFGGYMLLRLHFVFFDFEEPLVLFLLDDIAIMGLIVFAGYYAAKGMNAVHRKRREWLS